MAGTVLLAVERQFAAALLAASLGEAGFQVHWTAALGSAHRITSDEEFDAIVVDLSHPSPTMMRAVETLADDSGGPPVIAISPDHAALLSESVRFVVRKPFTGSELIETVRAAVSSGRARDPVVVQLRASAAGGAPARASRAADQEV